MEDLKVRAEELETKVLKARVEDLEKKLYLLSNNKKEEVRKFQDVDVETRKTILNNFFNEVIVQEKGKRINTATVLRRANEYAYIYNVKFTRFSFSDFMISKGIERKKVGGVYYYYDIFIKP